MKKVLLVSLIFVGFFLWTGVGRQVNAEIVRTGNDDVSYYDNSFEFSKISSGHSFSIALTKENQLFSWGRNDFGQLCNGFIDNHRNGVTTMKNIDDAFNFNQFEVPEIISTGYFHSAIITSENKVYTCGSNSFGILGNGGSSSSGIPTEITPNFQLHSDEYIKNISLGYQVSTAVSSDGRVFVWGSNEYGQLATNVVNQSYVPIDVTESFNFETGEIALDIFANRDHLALITSSNRVFTWGRNDKGQLGNGDLESTYIPQDITEAFELKEGESIVDIALGDSHSIALTNENNVFSWGDNVYDQLGIGYINMSHTSLPVSVNIPKLQIEENIDDIEASNRYSAIFTSQGRLIMWGENFDGQILSIGNGTTGSLIDVTDSIPLGEFDRLVDVSLGAKFASIVSDNGLVYTWGSNSYGELGNESNLSSRIPVQIGVNYFTQKEYNEFLPPNVAMMSVGQSHSLAYTYDNKLYGWGYNANGQVSPYLSDETVGMPINIELPFKTDEDSIDMMVTGSTHSAILTKLGNLYMFGSNGFGELGNGTVSASQEMVNIIDYFDLQDDEKIVKIGLGQNYSAALTSLGRLFTWGDNWLGKLGNGNESYFVTIPKEITSNVNLESGEVIIDLFIGDYHSAIITSENRVFTWGRNSHGQLGDGTGDDKYSPVDITDNLPITSNDKVKKLAFGNSWSVLLTVSGKVFTWGCGDMSRLGYSTPESKVYVPTNITNLFDLDSNEIIVDVFSRVAVTSKKHVYVWAHNYSGLVLGHNDFYVDTPIDITSEFPFNATDNFNKIYPSGSHASLLSLDGNVYSWGTNNRGQLGDGSFSDSQVIVKITREDNLYGEIAHIDYKDEVVELDTHVYLNIYPKYLYERKIEEIEINDVYYMIEEFENGLIKVKIDNIWTIGETGEIVINNLRLETGEVIEGNGLIKSSFIIIEDVIAPSFDIDDNYIIELGQDEIDWTTKVFNLKDNSTEALTITELENSINYQKIGTYSVLIEVRDLAGNRTNKSISVEVVDTTPPTFDNISDQEIEAGVDDIDWTMLVENLQDNSNQEIKIEILQEDVNYRVPGIYQVIIGATDVFGNTISKSFSVKVIDTTAPSFILESSIIIEAGADEEVSWEQYTSYVDDNSDGNLVFSIADADVNFVVPGTYSVIFRLTDTSGNYAEQSTAITIIDTTPPKLSLNPMDSTIPINTVLEETGVSIQDFSDTTMVIDSNLDLTSVGKYTITYIVTDDSGNVSIIERIVHVYEPEPNVQFNLEDALTSIEAKSTFEDPGCTATINGETLVCELLDNTLNTDIRGVYTIFYSVEYNGKTYTHYRYVFVYDVINKGEQILYYRKKQEEGVNL